MYVQDLFKFEQNQEDFNDSDHYLYIIDAEKIR